MSNRADRFADKYKQLYALTRWSRWLAPRSSLCLWLQELGPRLQKAIFESVILAGSLISRSQARPPNDLAILANPFYTRVSDVLCHVVDIKNQGKWHFELFKSEKFSGAAGAGSLGAQKLIFPTAHPFVIDLGSQTRGVCIKRGAACEIGS